MNRLTGHAWGLHQLTGGELPAPCHPLSGTEALRGISGAEIKSVERRRP